MSALAQVALVAVAFALGVGVAELGRRRQPPGWLSGSGRSASPRPWWRCCCVARRSAGGYRKGLERREGALGRAGLEQGDLQTAGVVHMKVDLTALGRELLRTLWAASSTWRQTSGGG